MVGIDHAASRGGFNTGQHLKDIRIGQDIAKAHHVTFIAICIAVASVVLSIKVCAMLGGALRAMSDLAIRGGFGVSLGQKACRGRGPNGRGEEGNGECDRGIIHGLLRAESGLAARGKSPLHEAIPSGRRRRGDLPVERQEAVAMTTKPPLTLYLAAPRGFCAGVDRAIKIVEMALQKWGEPVYVRHEIVHNRFVVDDLREKGAVFVEELDECPDDRPVIFSAHGVPKAVPAEAARRDMLFVDATCPLVSKVHIEAERHHENGLQIVMIGHAGHPETVGTMGQLPEGEVLLVETVSDVAGLQVRDTGKLAFVTQTTLSVDDTIDIVAALKQRFPAIKGPHKEDICYATTNRQEAVKAMAPKADAMLVVGAPNSSNSRRLVEVGAKAGCTYSQLVQRAGDIDWRALEGISSIGITAGASAPEVLVNEVIDAFRERYDVTTAS
jgi:4-hydroxy-3-methylbut-2-enyl diphosphate reductase